MKAGSLLRSRLGCVSAVIVCAFPVLAQSGLSVNTKLVVPDGLRRGTFSQDRYLNVPPGFIASVFALAGGARFLAVAPNGDVFVSQPGSGTVTMFRPNASGAAPTSYTYASGLNSPHGIAIHTIGSTTFFYIAETNRISRYIYNTGDTQAHDRQTIITGLPDNSTIGGYAHPYKSVVLDANDKLYVTIGSSCNVCASDTTADPVRGAIYVYNADGSGGRLYARGLRNAEGLAINPSTGQLWAAVNNRDNIPYPYRDSTGQYGQVVTGYVDNHPPDLFTSVRDGGNYGWPFCNENPDTQSGMDNMPFDPDLDTNSDQHVTCSSMDTVVKGIQAHSAPLGLAFLDNVNAPAAYRNGAVIALHGSWNRSAKTGYKVAFFPFDATTNKPGAQVDLITGWMDSSQNVWGRPVGVAEGPKGEIYVSDDAAGAIYKFTASTSIVSAADGSAKLAPGSLASAYGSGFPSQPAVVVQDANGTQRSATLYFSSATQINFQIPPGTAVGTATILVNGNSIGSATITPVAPALFSANGTGTGVAAATAVRIFVPTGEQSPVQVFTCSPSSCTAVPIDPGIDTPVYLSFYGTGISEETDRSKIHVTIGSMDVPVLYAGPQGQWPGLDQVNVGLPLTLRGAGLVNVTITVDGVTSNAVQIAVK